MNQSNISTKGKGRGVDILFLSHTPFLAGGGEISLLQMCTYLKGRGISCHVILPSEGAFSNELDKLGIGYTFISLDWWAKNKYDDTPFNYSGNEPGALAKIVGIIRDANPLLCVTNTVVIPWLAYGASITGTKHAWIIRELGGEDHQLKFAISDDQMIKSVVGLSDKIFFNSKFTANHYRRFNLVSDYGIIYPDINNKKLVESASPFRPNATKLIMVGQIKESKGQLDAIIAVRILRDRGLSPELAIIGVAEDKEYMSKIGRYIHDNNLEDIIYFLGFKTNPSSYVARADIALMCSRNEAFGRVTVESMKLGTPTVGANSGGTLEIIQDGITGLLYNQGDPEDLAEKIQTIIQDEQLALKLGENGKEFVTSRFSTNQIYSDFLDYFNSVSSKRNSGLTLRPIASVLDDYYLCLNELKKKSDDVQLLSRTLHDITASKSWRIIKLFHKLFAK